MTCEPGVCVYKLTEPLSVIVPSQMTLIYPISNKCYFQTLFFIPWSTYCTMKMLCRQKKKKVVQSCNVKHRFV